MYIFVRYLCLWYLPILLIFNKKTRIVHQYVWDRSPTIRIANLILIFVRVKIWPKYKTILVLLRTLCGSVLSISLLLDPVRCICTLGECILKLVIIPNYLFPLIPVGRTCSNLIYWPKCFKKFIDPKKPKSGQIFGVFMHVHIPLRSSEANNHIPRHPTQYP